MPSLGSSKKLLPMNEQTTKDYGRASLSQSSISENEKEEKVALLESTDPDDDHFGKRRGERPTVSRRRFAYAVGILSLSNVVFVVAFVVVLVRMLAMQPTDPPSWAPPERQEKRIFQYFDIYGGEPSPESEDAWTDLIPMGKGFVTVVNDTAIPDTPGLDQSLPQQHAMISVFHQMHCLYMTRAGYFSAKSGNLDEVNMAHLSHCWDYLRQALMCYADTTLEWLGPPPDDIGSTGWGYEHQCRDYAAIFAFATAHRQTDKKVIHS